MGSRDLKDYPLKELRSRLGFIPQKANLFTGSIRKNLAFARPDASDGELLEALKTAQGYDFVMEQKGGLDAPITEGGSNFSGGQKQRLCIARALVGKPQIYVFDDSFSALDFATGRKASCRLKPVTKDAVTLIVAQRVSTIMDADRILVLDNGEMAGLGTHRELLRTCPVYYEIAASQLTERSYPMKHKFRHFKNTAGRLAPYISPYRTGFFLSILMVCLTTLTLSISPTVEGFATSLLVKNAQDMLAGIPGACVQFDRLLGFLFILLGLYLLKTLTQSVMAFALTNSIQSAMHDLRDAVERKLARLPVKYFDTNAFGDVLSRVTNDLDTLSNGLQQTLMQILSGILQIILAFVMMLTINGLMTAVVFLIVPAAVLITRFVVSRSQRLFLRQQNTLGKTQRGHHGNVQRPQGNPALQQGGGGHPRLEDINARLQESAFKAQFMSSIISPLVSLSTYLVIGVTAIIGCIFALSGSIQVGQIQAFVRYVWQVNDPMSQVSNFPHRYRRPSPLSHGLSRFWMRRS